MDIINTFKRYKAFTGRFSTTIDIKALSAEFQLAFDIQRDAVPLIKFFRL